MRVGDCPRSGSLAGISSPRGRRSQNQDAKRHSNGGVIALVEDRYWGKPPTHSERLARVGCALAKARRRLARCDSRAAGQRHRARLQATWAALRRTRQAMLRAIEALA
jgi:hypothetical protein